MVSKIIMIIICNDYRDYHDYHCSGEAGGPNHPLASGSSCQRSSTPAPTKSGTHRVETLSLWPAVSRISAPLSVTALTSKGDAPADSPTQPTEGRMRHP